MPCPLLPHEDFNQTDAGYGCGTTMTEVFPPFDTKEPANPFSISLDDMHCERHCSVWVCQKVCHEKLEAHVPLEDCVCPDFSPCIEEDPRYSGTLPQIVSVPNSLIEEAREITEDFDPSSEVTIHYNDAFKLFDALRRTHKSKVRSTTVHKEAWSIFWKTLQKYLTNTSKEEGQRTETVKQIRLEMEGCLKIALTEIAYVYARAELPESKGYLGVCMPVYFSEKFDGLVEKQGLGAKIWRSWTLKLEDLLDLLVWRSMDVMGEREEK
jgi:hypothetical protein